MLFGIQGYNNGLQLARTLAEEAYVFPEDSGITTKMGEVSLPDAWSSNPGEREFDQPNR